MSFFQGSTEKDASCKGIAQCQVFPKLFSVAQLEQKSLVLLRLSLGTMGPKMIDYTHMFIPARNYIPPLPPFLPRRHFSVDGGGVYILNPPAPGRNRRVFSGVRGGGGVYKIWNPFNCLGINFPTTQDIYCYTGLSGENSFV